MSTLVTETPAVPRPASAPVIDPTESWTPPEVGWSRLAPFESNFVGVVRRVFAQLHDHDDIHLFGVGAQACLSSGVLDADCSELNGGGSTDPAQAKAAAIGETVERYSVAYSDRSTMVHTTPAELARRRVPHVSPEDLRLFDDSQFGPGFPFERFTHDTSLDWTWGTPLSGDVGRTLADPILVPAQLVHMGTPVHGALIGYATSNGLACGCTLAEATLGGLSELIERDAFMATWYGRLRLPRIDQQSSPALAEFFRRHVAPTGLDVELVDMSMLVDFPAVLAVVRNEQTPVAPLALGAAAAPSALTACRKAVIEAFQTRTWAKAEQREGAVLDPADGYEQVQTFDDHVRLSLHPQMVARSRFLDAGETTVGLADLPSVVGETPAQIIAATMRRLEAQGVSASVIDVTSPDVRAGGLHVAKVFAPRLSPLDAGYPRRFLGSDRLRTRAFEVGLTPAPLSIDDFNPDPHPFP